MHLEIFTFKIKFHLLLYFNVSGPYTCVTGRKCIFEMICLRYSLLKRSPLVSSWVSLCCEELTGKSEKTGEAQGHYTMKNRARWRMHPGLWEKAWLRLMSCRGNIRENINMGKKELKQFLSVCSFGISSRTVLIWLSLNAFRMDGLSSLRIQVRAGTGPRDVLYMGCTWVLSCPTLQSCGLWTTRLLCPRDFQGKSTGVCCHVLLHRIFPTQASNLGLLHCRWILYCLGHQGSPFFGFTWHKALKVCMFSQST